MSVATVQEIWRYPVKSVGGQQLDTAWIGPLGVEGDRQFGILDPAEGVLLSRKKGGATLLRLAAASAALDDDNNLHICHPDIEVTCSAEVRTGSGDTKEFSVLGDKVCGIRQDPIFDTYFSELVGREVQLVGLANDHARRADPDILSDPRFTSFTDGGTISLHSVESLAELAEALTEERALEITNEQFRSNIVVGGLDSAFEEDCWETIRIGSASLRVYKAMSRCLMTEQFRNPELPDAFMQVPRSTQALLKHSLGRYGQNTPTSKFITLFAQNVAVDSPGNIAVGDHVNVLYRSRVPNWREQD